MRKTNVIMNKPVYLGQAILDISKTLMYEFWYDYIKLKYKDKTQLCYMDMDSFIIHIETEDFYKDIANDVNKRYDTSGYNKKDKKPLTIGINKKVIGKFKDELDEKIMKEFCALRSKTYAFLSDNDEEIKKAKGTKKCVIRRMLRFENYKYSLFNNKTIYRSQQRFKSGHHTVCMEEINKIALSSNGDKRIQTYNGITAYPYGTNAFMVCEKGMLVRKKEIPIEMYYQ